MFNSIGFVAMLYGLMAGLVAFSMASSISRGMVRSPLERMFFLFSAATLIWNAAYAIMTLTANPLSVRVVYRVSSIAWGANPSIAMYYAYLLYCHYAGRAVSRRISAAIFLPVPFILFGVASGRLLAYDFIRSGLGWIEVVDPSSPWNYAFIAVMVAGLVSFAAMGFRLIKVARTNRARLHGRMITFPVVVIIVLVIVFHILLPMMGRQSFPPIIQQLLALWIVGITLVSDRYPVLSLSPLIAADAIVNSMSDMCALVDIDGVVRGANPALGEFLGIDAREAFGREARGLLPAALCDSVESAARSSEGRQISEMAFEAVDKTKLPCVVTVSAVRDTLDDPVGYVVIAREIREEKRLQLLSETDGLTGAYNRRKMEESIGGALSDPRKRSRPLSAIMIDIDHFKQVNDRFGHEAGDKAIVDFCSIVRNSIRGNDLFARWGGEEFVVLCTDTDKAEAAVLAERIRIRTEKHPFAHGKTLTASFGIAGVREGDSVDSLIRRADEAMYASKKAGRNRVSISPGE